MQFPLKDVAGMSVTVLGAARSGAAAARLLAGKGALVFVSDKGSGEEVTAVAGTLREEGITVETGGHSDSVYACDLMVISPGVPSDAPAVEEARRKGVEVVSELECASWFCPGPIVAVTGSNGKTTTTSLIGRMLSDARVPSVVAGNIGTAFSGVVGSMDSRTTAVLEVSSFQLDHIRSFRPDVAVLLNITSDHMDRYGGSMEAYARSKARIAMNQSADDLLVANADDPMTARIAARSTPRHQPFSTRRELSEGAWLDGDTLVVSGGGRRERVVQTGELSLKGMHNVSNSLAALLASAATGVGTASMRATLKNFKGVEHRIEFVREVRGVRYYNDSKATNVDSVIVALQAFDEPIVLMLGGRDKGNDYGAMKALVRNKVKQIIAIGESADTVTAAFEDVVPVERASSMDGAVASAAARASSGDVVLLSPACASFDWFRNYEHRGRVFKDLVIAL